MFSNSASEVNGPDDIGPQAHIEHAGVVRHESPLVAFERNQHLGDDPGKSIFIMPLPRATV
jgi:hypothetical protein